MIKQHYETLFAYTSHTTEQLLDKAALLDEADYHARTVDQSTSDQSRSIHDLFFHMLTTARGWRVALETGQQPEGLQADAYPHLASLREGFDQEQEAWKPLIDRLSDEEINSPVTLTSVRGQSLSMPIWRIFQHNILHSMQHHTEIAHVLSAKGHSPGDIDFLFYQE